MKALLLIYIGGGVLLALLSLPLMAEKIKPNPYYGFRISATLSEPQLWYASNKYFAKRQLVAALILTSAALGLYFVPSISVDAYALSVLGMFVVVFGVVVAQSLRYIKTIQ